MSEVPETAMAVAAENVSFPVTGSIAAAVNSLAWPIIVENLFQTALGTVDMMMVGTLGASALAGVGTAAQLLWVLQSALVAIVTGTTVLVARYTGARQPAEADRVVKQSVVLGAVASIVLALVGVFGSEWLIAIMGAEPEVIHLGAAYLRIVLISGIFMMGMFILGGALRGAGDSRTPMIVTGLINLVNIAVAWVLIFGKLGVPAMGVAGSAWGASVARGVGCLILAVLLLRGKRVINLSGRIGWRPESVLIRRILRLGIPSMAEQFLMSGGMLIYGMIAIRMGTLIYAAQRVTFQILSIAWLPGMGFAMAATALVGQYLGARRPDLAERSSNYAVRVALAWMAIFGLIAAVFGRPLMMLFTSDPEMIQIGARALIVIAISQPFQAVGQVMAGSLRGAGDTRFPMITTFLGIWLIRLPLGYLLGPVLGLGLSGIYVSNVLDAALRATTNGLRFRKGAWREIEV
jgi:multidrug resistance protein, MATE family